MESLYGSENLLTKLRRLKASKTEEEIDAYVSESRRLGVLNQFFPKSDSESPKDKNEETNVKKVKSFVELNQKVTANFGVVD